MKNSVLLFLALFLANTKAANAQKIITTDKETYTIEFEENCFITKKDINTKKVLFKVDAKIPDKNKKEIYNALANDFSTELIDENIVIVYDVWQTSTGTKDCNLKLLNVKTGKFNETKILYSTKINSKYSSHEIPYKAIYSPDKKKLAVLKDNISLGYKIDPELHIYDTKTFSVLSTKKINGEYEGQKRIFDLTTISIDNDGNITTVLHLMNAKTKMTSKSFSADIPFNESDFKNIKELDANASTDGSGNQNSHGRFYKNLEDYINDKPMQGVRIKNGSFHWSVVSGTDFKLIDDAGNIRREDSKDLPSTIFTYKSSDFSDPYPIRLIDKKPYIILVAGKLCYYSLYEAQQQRFYSEGWEGDLKKFKEKDLEEYLEKYNLLDDYKKDKPKREFKDDVNGYFNKVVNWHIKYFNLLNKKM